MLTMRASAIERAGQIARALLRTGKVNEVFLFGSTARGEHGRDIDMIATVSEEAFEDFVSRLHSDGLDDAYALASRRYNAAGEVLEWEEQTVYRCSRDYPLDVFLFPANWLSRLHDVHGRFNHDDERFTRNITADARRFDSEKGEFEAIPAHRQVYKSGDIEYTYSLHFGRPAIIIKGPMDADRVIAKAKEIGAVDDAEEPGVYDIVVEFRDSPGRMVGPETYTEDALRDSLAHMMKHPVKG